MTSRRRIVMRAGPMRALRASRLLTVAAISLAGAMVASAQEPPSPIPDEPRPPGVQEPPFPEPRAPRPVSRPTVTAVTTKVTTVSGLLTYTVFFDGQNVRVRGTLVEEGDATWLTSDERKVLVTFNQRPGDPPRDKIAGIVEVAGTFWDVGRLDTDDPRVAVAEFRALSERQLKKPWPGVGEMPVLVVRSTIKALPPTAPGVRSIALDPLRYVDQRVTVVGRFRGRNLYGDLPNSPGQGRWDFVIQSADAALWVTGIQPRGKGFTLNPSARVDTGRWLQVTGMVRQARGLSWIEGTEVTLAQPPAEPTEVPAAEPAPALPPPEVVFSAPTQDETDVALDVIVRIQFSRDMRGESFKGLVKVGYLGAESTERGEPQAPAVKSIVTYNAGNNSIEVRFPAPLERFRTVKIDLLEGIIAADGVSMAPWTLTFKVGG